MSLQKIVSRFDGCTLYECEAESLLEALQKAVRNGASLDGASLDGASLNRANLYGASLYRANLDGANLNRANLDGANLNRANLYGANLDGASLDGANLDGANLNGARINWQSHVLIAELLRRAAGQDVQKRMVAGLIAVSTDWCWEKFLAIEHEQREWALGVLAKSVQDDDGAPKELRERMPKAKENA